MRLLEASATAMKPEAFKSKPLGELKATQLGQVALALTHAPPVPVPSV
jgi:hypothetical protein